MNRVLVEHISGALQALGRVACLDDNSKTARAVAEFKLAQALLNLGAPLPRVGPPAPAPRPAAPPGGRERRRGGATPGEAPSAAP